MSDEYIPEEEPEESAEAGEGGFQHRYGALGRGGGGVVGPRRRPPVHVLVGAGWNHPCGGGHQDDQQKEDGIGRGHPELGLLQRNAPFIFRWWPPGRP